MQCFLGISAGFFLFGGLVPPLLYGIVNIGTWCLLAAGLFLVYLAYRWPQLHRSKDVMGFLKLLLIVSSLVLCGFLIPMGKQAWFTPPRSPDSTVIVLGCKIRGTEPSLMLRRRLDQALSFLKENPESNAVLSGGYGEGESYSEAWVMARYLTEKGIAEDRLYLEEKSRNTRENLLYSAEIISEQELSPQTVIATDGFHQLRASIYGRRAGLSAPASISSCAPWGLAPGYWVREFFAIIQALFL